MTEEYVYKIVVDDSEVSTALDKIDRQVVNLAQKMDGLFRNVGVGAGAGLAQTTQRVEQAGTRIRRSEQQTTQQIIRGQQQVDQARQRSFAVVEQELKLADERLDKARQNAAGIEEALGREREALQSALEDRRKAQEDAASERTGPAGAVLRDVGEQQTRAAQRKVDRFEQVVPSREAELGTANVELENAQQSYNQIAQEREALTSRIEQSAQQQAAVEAQASQETVSSAQTAAGAQEQASRRSGQASLDSARVSVQSARDVVRSLEQEQRFLDNSAQTAQRAAQIAAQAAATKRRAWEDAAAALKAAMASEKAAQQELANVSKDAGEGEKQALQSRIDGQREAVEAAKALESSTRDGYTTAKRQAEDLAALEKEANSRRIAGSREVSAASKQQRVATQALGNETRNLARDQRSTSKEQREAERLFVRTSKTYGKQRQELDKLAKKYGSFTVTLGKSSDELDEHEKEVYDVIKSDKQLEKEIDKLTNKYGQFNANIDRATFSGGPQVGTPRTAFRQAGFALGRAGVPGAATLGEAAAVGGIAGIAVVGVIASVGKLINMFQQLASVAVDTFKKIISSSVEAAKEIEVARSQFTAFFDQDTQAAGAALERLQRLSVELGENVVGIGRAFLPEVESLDQLEEVVKIATALARFQPEQGILGARIALQEALAGEYRSLQRRFEISPVAIDKIRSAMEAGGVTAGLEEIQAELERTGRSVEDLADTFSVSMGRVTERIRQVSQELGDPIIGEVADQFDAIDEQLERLEPDLDVIASAFGEVFARLVEIIGVEIESFLESFDPAPVLEAIEALNGVIEAVALVSDVLSGGSTAAYGFGRVMDNVSAILLATEGIILGFGKTLSAVRNDLEKFLFVAEVALTLGQFIPLNIGTAGPKLYGQVALNEVQALRESMSEGGDIEPFDWDAALTDLEERKAEFTREISDMVDASGDLDTAGEKMANRFLKIGQAFEELDSIQKRYAETQETVNEAIKEFNIDAALRFEKLLTDARRKRIDFEIESAQKSIDMERKNKQKIADIRTKFDLDILDAAQDLVDREADIMRKHGYDVLDLEDDRNKKRLEAEEKYLDALEKLRDKFNFQAFEAMLANDAKELRQIRRRQAFEESQLKKDEDRDLSDIDQDINDRKAKLDEALRREIESARIVNARKLRDLQVSLDEQLAKQLEGYKREIAEQGIAEKRKRDELNDELNQQLEDYDTWWQERHRVTGEGIAADLEMMQGMVDDTSRILGELSALGVGFNPLTGTPEFAYSTPTVSPTDTVSYQGILQTATNALMQLDAVKFPNNVDQRRTQGEIERSLEGSSISELLDLLRSTNAQLVDEPGAAPLSEKEFNDAARAALIGQAVELGAQIGLTEDAILGELPQSLEHLGIWIDDFVAEYSPRELPPFNIYGDVSQGPFGTPGPMSQMPAPPFAFPPGQQSTPTGQMGVPPQELLDSMGALQNRLINFWQEQLSVPPEFEPDNWFMAIERLAKNLNMQDLINALDRAQRTAGVTEGDQGFISTTNLMSMLMQGAQPQPWQLEMFPGLYPGGNGAVTPTTPYQTPYQAPYSPQYAQPAEPGQTSSLVPGMGFSTAVPGQTPFIFPSVTQAPYVIPEDMDFLPDLGQLMAAQMTGGGFGDPGFF